MFIKNVSNEDIVNYNCGYGNFVSVKAGEVVEVVDPRAVKNFLRLLSPRIVGYITPSKVEVVKVVEVIKPIKVEKPKVPRATKIIKKVTKKK